MKGKVLFVVGLSVGYVLGARAGRRRYEQIKSVAKGVWDSSLVQTQVHTVQDYAADRIGDLGEAITEGVKRTVTRSSGSAARAAANGASSGSARAKSAKAGTTSTKSRSTSRSTKARSAETRDDESTQDGGQAS